jgi:hypothetical protein
MVTTGLLKYYNILNRAGFRRLFIDATNNADDRTARKPRRRGLSYLKMRLPRTEIHPILCPMFDPHPALRARHGFVMLDVKEHLL